MGLQSWGTSNWHEQADKCAEYTSAISLNAELICTFSKRVVLEKLI